MKEQGQKLPDNNIRLELPSVYTSAQAAASRLEASSA